MLVLMSLLLSLSLISRLIFSCLVLWGLLHAINHESRITNHASHLLHVHIPYLLPCASLCTPFHRCVHCSSTHLIYLSLHPIQTHTIHLTKGVCTYKNQPGSQLVSQSVKADWTGIPDLDITISCRRKRILSCNVILLIFFI